jgi:hypothetical protein
MKIAHHSILQRQRETIMGGPPGGTIQAMAAATQSGAYGACLFTLDNDGILSFTTQGSPGGTWQAWQGPKFAVQPAVGMAIACAGQNNGELLLAMLDDEGMAWTLQQDAASGGWGTWDGPGVNDQQYSFSTITAGQQGGGTYGIQLFATDADGQIWDCFQEMAGAGFTRWGGPGFVDQEIAPGELAVAGQNNGCLMLIAEMDGQLLSIAQTSPGGLIWGPWSGAEIGGQSTQLREICACQQGGTRGLQLWGLDANGAVWTLFQDTAGGAWDPWQSFLAGQPQPFVTIAAADQNNGCTIFFGVDEAGDLWSVGQTAPGGSWGSWSQMTGPSG